MATLTYGLTTTGLAVKPLSQIRADINAQLQTKFGASIDVSDASFLGQFAGIMSEALYLLWELSEAINSSQDPDKATGAALDALCALTGTTRPAATASAVAATLTGSPTTVIPTATIVATASTNVQFSTTTNVTLNAVSAWAPSTAYTSGVRVTNNSNVYQCTTAGTSAGSGGPTTGSNPVPADGGVTWLFLGQGTAAADVPAVATATGPLFALAGDLTVKVSSVSGWQSVTNILDAVPGQNIATDAQLRLLRVAELAGDGASTAPAVEAALLKVNGVTAVTVFTNNTDYTNSDNEPPHSVEVMVEGGANQDIFDAVFNNVAAGIATYGNTSGTSTDSQGVSHAVSFTRPTAVDVYIVINLLYDATLYTPSTSDALVEQAIVAWGDAQPTGKDVVATAIIAQAFSVEGVLDVPTCYIGTAPSPGTSTTIPISLRQLMSIDSSRITLTSTPATP